MLQDSSPLDTRQSKVEAQTCGLSLACTSCVGCVCEGDAGLERLMQRDCGVEVEKETIIAEEPLRNKKKKRMKRPWRDLVGEKG